MCLYVNWIYSNLTDAFLFLRRLIRASVESLEWRTVLKCTRKKEGDTSQMGESRKRNDSMWSRIYVTDLVERIKSSKWRRAERTARRLDSTSTNMRTIIPQVGQKKFDCYWRHVEQDCKAFKSASSFSRIYDLVIEMH